MSNAFFAVFILLLAALLISQRVDESQIIDLGVAHYPQASDEASFTVHDWRSHRRASPYRVTYAHGNDAAAQLLAEHDALGDRFRFRRVTDQSFSWLIPKECANQEWTCIYSEVAARSEIDLEPLLDRIVTGFQAQEWTTPEAASWLLAFVQDIPYQVPVDHAFGLLPPALVASQDWGDCDSKSLLLMSMLDRIGIDSILLVSTAHAHAMVGIAVPTNGKTFRYRGIDFAYAEATAKAPLGWINPQLLRPNDWRPVPFGS